MPQSGLVRTAPSVLATNRIGPAAGVWISAPGAAVGSVAHGAGNGAAHPLHVNRRAVTDIGIRIDAGGVGRTAEVGLWLPNLRTSMPDKQIFYRAGLDASTAQFVLLSGLYIRTGVEWIWAGVAGIGGAVTFWNLNGGMVGDFPLVSHGGTATNPGSAVSFPDLNGLGVFGDWGTARGQSPSLSGVSTSRVYVKVATS